MWSVGEALSGNTCRSKRHLPEESILEHVNLKETGRKKLAHVKRI